MIKFNDNFIEFVNAGLFFTDELWKHPDITVNTYELIYVLNGTVNLYEGNQKYTLVKNDAIILKPGLRHGGTSHSTGNTSFYWLHFHTKSLDFLELKGGVIKSAPLDIAVLLRKINHSQIARNKLSCNILLLTLLQELNDYCQSFYKSGIINDIAEWIRINSHKNLSLCNIVEKYGYSKNHLSKKFYNEQGKKLKEYIIENRVFYVKNLLLNTNKSIKEIAFECNFNDDTSFVKFFKYHTGQTPTQLRNSYFESHMNNK